MGYRLLASSRFCLFCPVSASSNLEHVQHSIVNCHPQCQFICGVNVFVIADDVSNVTCEVLSLSKTEKENNL